MNEMEDHEIVPRAGHVSIPLLNNWIAIWGGYTDDRLSEKYCDPSEILLYNSEVNQWLRKHTTGEIPSGTAGACSVFAKNNIYILGGHSELGYQNLIFELSVGTWEWKQIRTLHQRFSRRDKFAAWHYEEKIFVFGGYGLFNRSACSSNGYFHRNEGQLGWNNEICIFDLNSQDWLPDIKTHGKAPSPRAAHASVLVESKAFIFGGRHGSERLNDLHYFDCNSLTWSGEIICDEPIPIGRSWHTLTQISNKQLLLYGGYSTTGLALNDNAILNIDTFRWFNEPIQNAGKRLWHSINMTFGKDVVLFGGHINDLLGEQPEMTNKLCIYRFTPKSLYTYCIDKVSSLQFILKPHFVYLPHNVISHLNFKSTGLKDGFT